MEKEEILARFDEDIQLHGLSEGTGNIFLYKIKEYLRYAGKPIEELLPKGFYALPLLRYRTPRQSISSITNQQMHIYIKACLGRGKL